MPAKGPTHKKGDLNTLYRSATWDANRHFRPGPCPPVPIPSTPSSQPPLSPKAVLVISPATLPAINAAYQSNAGSVIDSMRNRISMYCP
jgi:hypothetical protein